MRGVRVVVFVWEGVLYDEIHKRVVPEAQQVFSRLVTKGYRVAVVCAGSQTLIRECRAQLHTNKLRSYVTALFTACDDEACEPVLYQTLLDQLKCQPAELAIVNKRMTNGMIWARDHGCTTMTFEQALLDPNMPEGILRQPHYLLRKLANLLLMF